ncbi:DUF2460 domain-containing protein [Prosthecomicrobium hirschii]|uniref:DUF2460 domain-containing protein n=1 Tax=Prosthecodimorpha hirschii TaxID=665126 RepID=UPI0022200481|nr:DUF2460 domain-containing protein [Prosthecomicrobium hirschii]MCW1840624.1 DUF2460 domain-containing protein [Prosthecomicrobium hirschii]
MTAPVAFHEVLFPAPVAFGASGGPERRTDIVPLASGFESRNQRWADSRRRYDAGTGLRSRDDLAELVAFFEARRGRLIGFRFRDGLDDRSCLPSGLPGPLDQAIGTGTGALAVFALAKTYGTGEAAWTRAIAKPVAGSVRVAVGGVERTEGVHFTVDATTGLITFSPASVPPDGAAVTAGFRFHVPVRFDTDALDIDVAGFLAGQAPSVPLVEIRP